jgi:hypothetical protein
MFQPAHRCMREALNRLLKGSRHLQFTAHKGSGPEQTAVVKSRSPSQFFDVNDVLLAEPVQNGQC